MGIFSRASVRFSFRQFVEILLNYCFVFNPTTFVSEHFNNKYILFITLREDWLFWLFVATVLVLKKLLLLDMIRIPMPHLLTVPSLVVTLETLISSHHSANKRKLLTISNQHIDSSHLLSSYFNCVEVECLNVT